MSEKIGLFLFCASATEFRTSDGSGDGHVKTLGTWSLMEIRDEQTVGHPLTNGFRDTVALVAHDDDAIVGKGLLVDVLAVEQGTVDGKVAGQCVEELQQVCINYMYVRETSHCCLYHLRVVGISSVFTAKDGVDAEPVGNADDGAEVTGILHTVESQIEVRGER